MHLLPFHSQAEPLCHPSFALPPRHQAMSPHVEYTVASISHFPRFSYLPKKVRLQIWALNLPGPRLVALKYTSPASTGFHRRHEDDRFRGCTSPTLIPANLHTNREARNHASKYYQLSFNLPHCSPKIFFNPSIDILYFGKQEGRSKSWKQFVDTLGTVAPAECSKVQRLAIHESLFIGAKNSGSSAHIERVLMKQFCAYLQHTFDSLRDIIVVVEEEDEIGEQEWKVGMLGLYDCPVGDKVSMRKGCVVENLESALRCAHDDGGVRREYTVTKWSVLPVTTDIFDEGWD